MNRTFVTLAAVVLAGLLANPALAQGPAPAPQPAPGGGFGPRPATGPALPIEQAILRARQYLGQYQNADLVLVEVIEFANVFYVVVQEKSSGKGAFALLVNRLNGNVHPEMGPPMAWNTRYRLPAGGPSMMGPGAWGSGVGPGRMGGGMGRGRGMGPGMMGPGFGPGFGFQQGAPGAAPAAPQAQRPSALDEAKARAALQTWVAQAFPGATIGKAVEFPGFFTYRLIREGKTFALVSVNAYGGQTWYAWQYGVFVKEQAIR